MPDWLIDVAITALLRMLRDKKETSKWRRAMLKVFKAIRDAYNTDEEFIAEAGFIGGK